MPKPKNVSHQSSVLEKSALLWMPAGWYDWTGFSEDVASKICTKY